MKLVRIGYNHHHSQRIKIVNLKDLKDQDGNEFELPPDPKNDLVFDPRARPRSDSEGYTFDIEIQDSSRLVVKKTSNFDVWRDLYFRVYDRTKEDVPIAFDSSVPYDYWGLNRERAPFDTVVVKVHRTATTIKRNAFAYCKKMTTCDMSSSPAVEIELSAFFKCPSLRSVLFSQGLEMIGREAFYYCYDIDVLVIPSSVTYIGWTAFGFCKNLRILKLPDNINLHCVDVDIIDGCAALLDKVPANQTPKQWLKHRYDPYPLHKVCYNAHVTTEQIQQCIDTHPQAAYLSDEFDMTALHMITIMACTSSLHVQTQSHDQHQHQDEDESCLLGCAGHITACFDANMSAAFALDDRGKTPLDYLLESCDGLDVHTGLVTSLCLHRSASPVVLHGASSSCQQDSFKRRRYH